MQIEQIQFDDAGAFAEWFALWRLTDLEAHPDETGWDEQDFASMTQPGRATEARLLQARDEAGLTVGAAMVQVPLRDNRHAYWADLRVHSDHRRQGVGRALATDIERRAREDGRTVINAITDVPVGLPGVHPSEPFALAMGYAVQHSGNRRSLGLPMPADRVERLRHDVATARGADAYRIVRLRGLWPDEFVEDQCILERAMSTDQPQGDSQAEEEVWDAARVAEAHELHTSQGLVSLVAAAQHIASGRLVAYSRVVISERRPNEAWQWATIVLAAHRGHRLGLAVKMANIDFLAEELPTARKVITSNAGTNAPMIAVNDVMGFEIDANGAFWQRTL